MGPRCQWLCRPVAWYTNGTNSGGLPMTRQVVAVLTLLAPAAFVHAATLPRAAKLREIERVKQPALRIEFNCSCKVDMKVDTDSFPDESILLGAGSLGDELADAAERQCRGKAGRRTFCAKIKTLVVGYSATPEPPKLDKGTLRIVRTAAAGGAVGNLWEFFESTLDTPLEPVGDTPDEADADVKSTAEMLLATGSQLYPADASTEEKDHMRSYWEGVATATDRVVAACRTRPKVSVDWPTFKGEYRTFGPSVCEHAMLAIIGFCTPKGSGDAESLPKAMEAAATARKKIKLVRCHMDPSLKAPDGDAWHILPRYELKNGVFDIWANIVSSDGYVNSSYAEQFLRDNI